jgi:putative addiction module killer protein
MYSVLTTDEFDKWLSRLRDQKAKARITARIRSAEFGNFGDVRTVGSGVSEMRIHYGPGYRVYFAMRKMQLIIVLIGGDKSSQERDINKARSLASELGDIEP